MTTYLTAIPPAPEYGPHRRGRDSVQEILAEVSDITDLPPAEWHAHMAKLAAAYPTAAFVDALVCIYSGIERIRGDR